MQSVLLYCFFALVACTQAKVHYRRPPPGYVVGHPDAAYYYPREHHRHGRDTTWQRRAGGGTVYGTLGSRDDSIFGTGGYRGDIFNDRRGRLQGEGYGTRVLGAGGDSSILGGKLNWNNANENIRAGVDVHKQIGGGSGMRVTGDGVWKLDHNTRFVTGGHLEKQFGHHRPEGTGGYRGDIFNDRRGRLQGEGYGTRVLGAGGDSSILGGKLNWNNANENIRAGVDVHKQIGGGSGMRVTGDGVWKLDHNTRFVTGGHLEKQFGHHRPEGTGGYRGDIFNDRRGRLQGEGYGTRVLGAGGDSSILGGKLNWNNANENIRAGVDVHKQIGGGSGMRVTGDGVWKLDHNTRFVTGGHLEKQFGHHRPEVGIQGAIEHDF